MADATAEVAPAGQGVTVQFAGAAEPEPEPEPASGAALSRQSTVDRLASFQALPGGDACADCGAPAPSWASSNVGALICIKCSGVHRLIGTEYSAPLSVKLDDWDDEHIAHMLRGNDAVNAELEADLPPGLKPTPDSDRQRVEAFIWSKYALRAFAAGGTGTVTPLPAERGGGKEGRSDSDIGVQVYAGILFVHAKSASGLKNKDFIGKSDPYLVCRVGTAPQTAVTKVVDGSLAPEWNETVTLNVPSLEDLLLVECFDSDSNAAKSTEEGRKGDDIL